jgi:hypothetical protein
MMKKIILTFIFLTTLQNLLSQQHYSYFIPEFQKVYEKLIARTPDGSIVVPGVNNKGSIMLMAINRNGETIWAKKLPYGFELLDFCLDENSNYLLLVKEKSKSPDNELILLGLNKQSLAISINKKIIYDNTFSFDLATIIIPKGGEVKIIAADTSSRNLAFFQYNNIDSLIQTTEFKVPYPNVSISTLDLFYSVQNQITITENRARFIIYYNINISKVNFYRTDYGFLGINTRRLNFNGITGYTDQRQNVYNRWLPVRRTNGSVYKSIGIPSLECTDGVAISAAMTKDSIISYVYTVDSDTNKNKKFIRLHTFSYDMQLLNTLTLSVNNNLKLRTVFHQPYESGIILYVVYNEDGNDLVYEYKFESSSLKSQRENCFSMSENDSLKTYDMITPWVHSNAEATLTHKFSSTKTMMFPKLETQKISRVPDCSIPINAPKEQFKSYPNPFYKEIEFEYNLNESSDVSFVFYNIQGSVVYQTKTSIQQIGMYKTSFDLSELRCGIYYVIMTGNNVRKKTIIVKQ